MGGGHGLLYATAVAFKITAGPALVIPALAFVLRPVTLSAAWLPAPARVAAGRVAMLGAVPAAVALFLLMNPHFAIHWQAALGDVQNRAKQTMDGGFAPSALRKPGLEHLEAVVDILARTAFHRWELAALIAFTVAVLGLVPAIRAGGTVCVVGAAHAIVAVLALALTSKAFLVRNYSSSTLLVPVRRLRLRDGRDDAMDPGVGPGAVVVAGAPCCRRRSPPCTSPSRSLRPSAPSSSRRTRACAPPTGLQPRPGDGPYPSRGRPT